MKTFNIVLILALIATCMSLVTSRHQQRTDFAMTERENNQARRLEQDFQNLTVKQQQLDQTERIERLAREDRNMERIPPSRTVFITQSVLQGVLDAKPYVRATTTAQQAAQQALNTNTATTTTTTPAANAATPSAISAP
jgi:cell division protein FtsL